MRRLLLLTLTPLLLIADPPEAMVYTKLQVPAALHSGTFAQDRFLNLPPGFQISLLARVSGARFMTVAPNGDIFISQPGSGKITLLRPDANGGAPAQFTYAAGLNSPQSMVFQTIGTATYLYVSETQQVRRYLYGDGDTQAHDSSVIVPGLPTGGSHPLKNIAFGADGKLYVALGSSCNVCAQDTVSSPLRAAVYVYNADGSGGRLFARGLRNAEGLAFLPGSNQLWVVMNNRDDIPYPLKDSTGNYGRVLPQYVSDHPPDLFTSVRDGGNYGWPFCNSNPDNGFDRMPFDNDGDLNGDGHVNCGAMDTPDKGIQAHSAPLGLSLLQNSLFAAPYRNGAVIGLHGSWDRAVPTGYKVIWYSMDGPVGAATDLVTGWLDNVTHTYWGRPVSAVADSSGALLIADDQAGVIYRMTYSPGAVSAASAYALLAPESLGSVYGVNLASTTASADSADWHSELGGVSLIVKDSQGTSRSARLSYVSSGQINFEVPAGTAGGQANLTIQTPNGAIDEGQISIAPVSPGVFVADTSSAPMVTLYATGVRGLSSMANVQVTIGGAAATVLYAGPQGGWPGLDQVNFTLPDGITPGRANVVVTVDGRTSNAVTFDVR